jgi:hypothetical protein
MPSRRVALALLALLVFYVGSYLGLSRRGFLEANQWNLVGFYYFTPENTDGWRTKNHACVLVYAPINMLDCELGTGRVPAKEPMWSLSR